MLPYHLNDSLWWRKLRVFVYSKSLQQSKTCDQFTKHTQLFLVLLQQPRSRLRPLLVWIHDNRTWYILKDMCYKTACNPWTNPVKRLQKATSSEQPLNLFNRADFSIDNLHYYSTFCFLEQANSVNVFFLHHDVVNHWGRLLCRLPFLSVRSVTFHMTCAVDPHNDDEEQFHLNAQD